MRSRNSTGSDYNGLAKDGVFRLGNSTVCRPRRIFANHVFDTEVRSLSVHVAHSVEGDGQIFGIWIERRAIGDGSNTRDGRSRGCAGKIQDRARLCVTAT